MGRLYNAKYDGSEKREDDLFADNKTCFHSEQLAPIVSSSLNGRNAIKREPVINVITS